MDADAALQAYYALGQEQDRLDDPQGALELERTQEILLRRLPPPPAVVADVGGGPGRYAVWLTDLGYTVEHRDLMPLHVDQLTAAARSSIRTAVADARDLDLPDGCADAMLLLGPLYHLTDRADRVQALREAHRVVRDGGVVFAAAISRWAPRLDGMVTEQLYRGVPEFLDELSGVETTGDLPPVIPNGFCGYTHRPYELVAEVRDAGLEVLDLVGVEGMPLSAAEMAARRADPMDWRVLLDAARALERVPELLGLSSHLICTARAPG